MFQSRSKKKVKERTVVIIYCTSKHTARNSHQRHKSIELDMHDLLTMKAIETVYVLRILQLTVSHVGNTTADEFVIEKVHLDDLDVLDTLKML